MSGTKAGGLKAAATNKALYGNDFYKINGRKGGMNGTTGGFAANRELARLAGAKGGRKSRRGPSYDLDWKKIEHVAIDMYNDGKTIKEIADFTGMPYFPLRYRIRKAIKNGK